MNLLIKSGSEKLEKIIDNFKNYDVKITNEVNEKNIANADCLIIISRLFINSNKLNFFTIKFFT